MKTVSTATISASKIMVDDKDASITYNGTWSTWTDAGDFGGSETYGNTPNGYVQFTFTGTSIQWIGAKGNNCGKADVYIDGSPDSLGIDCYNSSKLYQQILYSKTGLSDTTHTLKVVVTGSKNASSSDTYISIDAFSYDGVARTAPSGYVDNEIRWMDDSGNKMQNHEGGISKFGSTYYWYGVDYSANPTANYGTNSRQSGEVKPFKIYSSSDLVNWHYENIAFDLPTSGLVSTGSIHRPHVIYNANTGKYVMWFFEFMQNYPDLMITSATSSSPTGPFTIQGRVYTNSPINQTGQDFSFFQDSDGSAYVVYDDGSRSIRIDKLDSSYLGVVSGQTTVAIPSSQGTYESPQLIKLKGKYIVLASGVNGYDNTPTTGCISSAVLGKYTRATQVANLPMQGTQLLYISSSDTCFLIADNFWPYGYQNFDDARAWFVPLTLIEKNNAISLTYYRYYNPVTGQGRN